MSTNNNVSSENVNAFNSNNLCGSPLASLLQQESLSFTAMDDQASQDNMSLITSILNDDESVLGARIGRIEQSILQINQKLDLLLGNRFPFFGANNNFSAGNL